WKPVKAHHRPEECRIEFMPESNCSEMEAAEIDKTLSYLIAQGLTSKFYTDEIGFSWVGFCELSPWPCCVKHLKSLS
ncbi:hypothetical protein, partial [Photobacterium sp. R1]